jgi:hypothetical protein
MSAGHDNTSHHDHGGTHTPPTMGVHGMLLFCSGPIYLSHLPMFGTPHNFQVILEVTFDEATTELVSADAEGIFTFAPVEFPIAELDPDGEAPVRTTIEGTVFRGHFERGGKPIASGVVATVKTVVYFNELDVAAEHDAERPLTYLCFGTTAQLHLAHRITASPDFDQILDAGLIAGTVVDPAGRPVGEDVAAGFATAVPVQIRGRTDIPENRLSAGETVSGFFFASVGPTGSHGFGVDLALGTERYLELRELGSHAPA